MLKVTAEFFFQSCVCSFSEFFDVLLSLAQESIKSSFEGIEKYILLCYLQQHAFLCFYYCCYFSVMLRSLERAFSLRNLYWYLFSWQFPRMWPPWKYCTKIYYIHHESLFFLAKKMNIKTYSDTDRFLECHHKLIITSPTPNLYMLLNWQICLIIEN